MKHDGIYFRYQLAQWYASNGAQEYDKLARFLNTSLLVTLAGKALGVNIGWLGILGINLGAFVLFTIIGKILAVTGVIDYNNRLNGDRSPQTQEILEILRRLDKK